MESTTSEASGSSVCVCARHKITSDGGIILSYFIFFIFLQLAFAGCSGNTMESPEGTGCPIFSLSTLIAYFSDIVEFYETSF